MDPQHSPLVDSHGAQYLPEPYSGFDLGGLRWGLPVLGIFATLSVVSTLLLISFIASRFLTWHKHYKTFIGYNQYVVLVLNLLIADLQQSASFLISWHWFRLTCFACRVGIFVSPKIDGKYSCLAAVFTWYAWYCVIDSYDLVDSVA